jgi:hypothetical protein
MADLSLSMICGCLDECVGIALGLDPVLCTRTRTQAVSDVWDTVLFMHKKERAGTV